MQQSRTNASRSRQYEPEQAAAQPHPKTFPSKPPAHVEQQKRQKRLQRQKEIDGFFRQSTSESIPETDAVTEFQSSKKPANNRPVLQRQQRQSSEESGTSSIKGNVHFKDVPEYFEDNRKPPIGGQRHGIYDTLKNVVTEKAEYKSGIIIALTDVDKKNQRACSDK